MNPYTCSICDREVPAPTWKANDGMCTFCKKAYEYGLNIDPTSFLNLLRERAIGQP